MNKRKYTRVITSFNAQLILNSTTYPICVLDLSLHGALITAPTEIQAIEGTTGTLLIELSPQTYITFDFKVSHIEERTWGLEVELTDLDSITHLRRLIELNLGDSEILHRELAHLSTE